MEQKYAASAIIYNNEGLVLLARRAPTKRPFPNVLSLPSTYVKDCNGKPVKGPISDDEVRRQLTDAVKQKLNLDIVLEDVIGTKEGQQTDYLLHMTDYFARYNGGNITPNGDDFSEVIFVDPLEKFRDKDRSKMGFCTQVLLQKLGAEPLFWQRYFL
ncbi:MAG TPA: NUDIX hydrolase [Candidatus Nanoarchaeia archaeon]|nr:NUDIX hydrolase [Candidatus Nanoarchaeia archaeon]